MLTCRSKELVVLPGTYERTIQYVNTPMFEVLSHDPDIGKIIHTYAGFLQLVTEQLHTQQKEYKVFDKRKEFPLPNFDKMFGFRFSQKPLIVEGLRKNSSGLIGAPTRYGKTTLIINTIRAFPKVPTVLTMPGKDLVKQSYLDLKEKLHDRKVVHVYGNKLPGDDVNVVSVDSLHKIDKGRTRLLLIDEPHQCVTARRLSAIMEFENCRKYGFGATLTGRFDGRDSFIVGGIGPVLANRTYLEAVQEGAICEIVVIIYRIKFRQFTTRNRDTAYKAMVWENKSFNNYVKQICDDIIPSAFQNIVFINNEKQADALKAASPKDTVAMAKKLTDKERNALFERMASGEVTRCIASQIYAQGVTFSDLRCIVNAAGGGASTQSIQKPGRLAEIRPGKACGIMFDFVFECKDNIAGQYDAVVRDSWNRFKMYKTIGYTVHLVDSLEEAQAIFNKEVAKK